MGEKQALNQNWKTANRVFEEYGDMIRDTIRFYINDKSIVDDIFHDFFLYLVRKPIPSGIQNIESYLRRAVKNDVLDAVAQTKASRTRNQKYARLHIDDVRYHNPVDIVIMHDQVSLLLSTFDKQLMPCEAQAIKQRYLYDQDIDEAAQVMRINRRSFSRYLCTALKKVRYYIQKNELKSSFAPS